MKVAYYNQNPPRPGYGELIVSEMGAVPGEVSFMLKRASDQMVLALAGWQEAETYLKPKSASLRDDGLHLQIGPEVVDNLDMQESYRFYLAWPGGPLLSAGLKVSALLYSPLSASPSIAQATPPTAFGVQPVPQPAPALEAPAPHIAIPKPEEEQPKPQPNLQLGMPDLAGREAKPATGRKAAIICVAILVVILGCLGGAYYLGYFGAGAKPQAAPLEMAYQHLAKDNASAADSLALAQKIWPREDDNARDAAFLLFEDAANKGDKNAMLVMGRYYDPTDNAPHGSIIKDAEQAYAWYEKALNAGLGEAKAKMEALQKWMGENG